MKNKKIDNFYINPIGIGTWMVGGGKYKDGTIYADYDNDEKNIDAIRYCLSKGQNHIDTGQIFSEGHTEEIIGKAIEGFDRRKIFIASKVWRTHIHRSAVQGSAEIILRRLDTDYIDLLNVHKPWNDVPFEETIKGINDAIDFGLVKSIGVNNFNLEQLKKASLISKHPIVANQVHFNILNRGLVTEEMRDYCLENSIIIVAYKPLERGKLVGFIDNKTIMQIADKFSRTVSQIALNWIISQNGIVAIPNSMNKKHIDENLGSLEFDLEEEDIKILNKLS